MIPPTLPPHRCFLPRLQQRGGSGLTPKAVCLWPWGGPAGAAALLGAKLGFWGGGSGGVSAAWLLHGCCVAAAWLRREDAAELCQPRCCRGGGCECNRGCVPIAAFQCLGGGAVGVPLQTPPDPPGGVALLLRSAQIVVSRRRSAAFKALPLHLPPPPPLLELTAVPGTPQPPPGGSAGQGWGRCCSAGRVGPSLGSAVPKCTHSGAGGAAVFYYIAPKLLPPPPRAALSIYPK